MSEDSLTFRQALGAFPTGVAIITTEVAGGEAAAITINSFASVSLDPKLILWSLGDQSDAFQTFAGAELWGVSFMAAEDEAVARTYSVNGRPNAARKQLDTLAGAPVFKNALATFACRTFEKRPLGDHLLIVGEVLEFTARLGPALSYHRGRFGVMGES